MNLKAHASAGLFSALAVFLATGDLTASVIVFAVQVGLILDFLFKKAIQFEPLHSLIGMIAIWVFSILLLPAYHWFVLMAYAFHLFLDIFVDEEIPLLYPSKKRISYPIESSEKIVIIASLIISIILIGIIFLF